jgi:hypothetical protein
MIKKKKYEYQKNGVELMPRDTSDNFFYFFGYKKTYFYKKCALFHVLYKGIYLSYIPL